MYPQIKSDVHVSCILTTSAFNGSLIFASKGGNQTKAERMYTSQYWQPQETQDQRTKSIIFPTPPRQAKAYKILNWGRNWKHKHLQSSVSVTRR